MEKLETLKRVSDVTVQEPITFEVDIIYQSKFEQFLMNRGIKPKKRVFQIYPVTLGSLIKISKLLISIDTEVDSKDIMNSCYKLMSEHAETAAKIVAVAIHNRKGEPPAELVEFIMHSFTANELSAVMLYVLKQMNVTDFMNSITSMKGLNVIENAEKKKPENGESPLMQGS